MKRFLSIALALVMLVASLALFTGCGEKAITIAVPNDTTNEARALLLLEELGYITLADGAINNNRRGILPRLCWISFNPEYGHNEIRRCFRGWFQNQS